MLKLGIKIDIMFVRYASCKAVSITLSHSFLSRPAHSIFAPPVVSRPQAASDPPHAGAAADPQPQHSAAGRHQDRGICRCAQLSVATQLALCKLQDELQLLQKLYDTSDDQILFVTCRHRQNHHAGEVRRAAATPPLPVRGLQQVGGQRGAAPLPQQRDQQDRALVGLCRHRQEVSALASVFEGDFGKKSKRSRRQRKN